MRKISTQLIYIGVLGQIIGSLFNFLHHAEQGKMVIIIGTGILFSGCIVKSFSPDKKLNKYWNGSLKTQIIWQRIGGISSIFLFIGIILLFLKVDGAPLLLIIGFTIFLFFFIAISFYANRTAIKGKQSSVEALLAVGLTVDELERYEGVYTNEGLPLKITITSREATLVAQVTGQSPCYLDAVDKNKFQYEEGGTVVEFDIDKREMILKQNGGYFPFIKEA